MASKGLNFEGLEVILQEVIWREVILGAKLVFEACR